MRNEKGQFVKGTPALYKSKTQFKRGELHPNWKGDKVGYFSLHDWIKREFGKPNFCEDCGVTTKPNNQYHWANISQKYIRNRGDWKRLCALCHRRFDISIGIKFSKKRIHPLIDNCKNCGKLHNKDPKHASRKTCCSIQCARKLSREATIRRWKIKKGG